MGKTTGFLEYERVTGPVISEEMRIFNFNEFHSQLTVEEQKLQAARCMDCGLPFCQAGAMIAGMASGCPLNNLVPEFNDLVYKGNLELAYKRLSMTHSFPEFTSRVCPALCENACTCGLHDQPVATKENEKLIVENAFAKGLVSEKAPKTRTGKKVAVVGSGPSGLAVAQFLNRRGHSVTVYERNDRIGGLLRYGIPNMKLDKAIIDRRVHMMEEAGISFVTNVNVCGSKKYNTNVTEKTKYISAAELEAEYDAVVLACGASNPRDIKAPGREAKGIYFAVDFLGRVTKSLLDNYDKKNVGSKNDIDKNIADEKPVSLVSSDITDMVKGKDVVVIGGGDTGNDCLGSCIRLGAKSVTQLEMMPCPPAERLSTNPWPEWPRTLKTDYGQEEAIYKFGNDPRVYQTTVKEFISEKKDKESILKSVVIVDLKAEKDEKTGRMNMVQVEGSQREIPAQLVLIAAGFLGSESYVTEGFGVAVDGRTNVKTDMGHFATSKPGVFVAGDMHRGQSLVVWAIAEGRKAAMEVDHYLMYEG
ncbi:MAG: glutamate synthase subunit beta [Eubacterium sp.]|nr:glutamate synthase subunit beta [Eubacterium sp.]